MRDEYKDYEFNDPAEQYPFLRLIIRYSAVILLLFLLVFIPGITFYLVSIRLQLQTIYGTILGLLSFALYLYLAWKKELWNIIKR